MNLFRRSGVYEMMPRPRHRPEDEPEFEAFVANHGRRLLRIAFLLTCDPQLAEDLHQETLARLATRWASVQEPVAFCRRVLYNLVIDRARRRARRPREQPLVPGDARFVDDRSEAELGAVEIRPALLRALERLTPGQRAVTVLRYFDDRSEAEVARILGIAPGTVKSTASHAMARLRADRSLAALLVTTDSTGAP